MFRISTFACCFLLHLIPVLPNLGDILLQLLSRVPDFLLEPVYCPLLSLSGSSFDDVLCALAHKTK